MQRSAYPVTGTLPDLNSCSSNLYKGEKMRITTGFVHADRVLSDPDKFCLGGVLVVMATFTQAVAAAVFADGSVSGNTTVDFDGAFGSGVAVCAGTRDSDTNTASGAEAAAATGHLQAGRSITAAVPARPRRLRGPGGSTR